MIDYDNFLLRKEMPYHEFMESGFKLKTFDRSCLLAYIAWIERFQSPIGQQSTNHFQFEYVSA